MLTRSDLILKYIVEYFIKTATPVGSHTLIENFDLSYSSATIRNEMAHLENLGYIEKTHASSGRVPSAEGYRYYVKYLRDANPSDVDEQLKNQLALILDKRSKSIEEVLKESCEILSHMTNLASVVLGPNANEEHLASIQLIPLSKNSASCVFVTDKGYVENKTFVLDKSINMQDLQECMKMLNERLIGAPISSLVERMEALKPLISDYIKQNDAIYRVLADALIRFTEERVSLFGQSKLFNQPEFNNDTLKLKKMLELIEKPENMTKFFHQEKSEDKLDVLMGEEEEMKDLSIVRTDLNIGGKSIGKIALVGPRRMDYDQVLSALEYVMEKFDEVYNDLGKDEDDEERKAS